MEFGSAQRRIPGRCTRGGQGRCGGVHAFRTRECARLSESGPSALPGCPTSAREVKPRPCKCLRSLGHPTLSLHERRLPLLSVNEAPFVRYRGIERLHDLAEATRQGVGPVWLLCPAKTRAAATPGRRSGARGRTRMDDAGRRTGPTHRAAPIERLIFVFDVERTMVLLRATRRAGITRSGCGGSGVK